MKTEVFLKRPLLDGFVRQSNLTGFFNVNDVLLIGNKWRILKDMKPFSYNSWYNSTATQEFINELKDQYGPVLTSKKGKTGERWVHPFLFMDLCLAINPKLKVKIYKWIFDELLKYRNNSGDSYKKMCGALYCHATNKTTFSKTIVDIAERIREACQVDDWQSATEEQLKLRDKIHENIYLLCDVLKSTKQATRIGIQKAIE